MRVIRSTTNPRLQHARKVLRGKEKRFFTIEGAKLFEEAIRSGMFFEEIFVTGETSEQNREMLTFLEQKGVPVNLISSRLAHSISDVQAAPGLIALLKRPFHQDPNFRRLAVFLISVRDPGNFGTIVRSAEGAGCEVLFYSSDCVDPFQPKVVRASMGSIFRVPLMEVRDPKLFLENQYANKIAVCRLEARSGRSIQNWKPSMPALICIGSESHGLPKNLPVTEIVSIPMYGAVESLNAAVAASICLYWISLTCPNQN